MGDIALKVQGLGKRYRIGAEQGGIHRYKSLRDSLSSLARRPMEALRETVIREPMDESNSFWALRDINFQVKRGEVVGIIGRNGAGKSTLLKILSRITKPTTGHVALYGRVGSLLEVGTGFHPELTGRENIFLNGAVLGMTRTEIKAKFDEIVAFSEIEKFLDTAVKHYSSGMYMRLAFAVAAHLEPEILVVDEVLAVGDVEFQKRCLGKMKDITAEGRTVFFVSHNMVAVQSLCRRALLLSHGELSIDRDVATVISSYLKSMGSIPRASKWEFDRDAPGTNALRVGRVEVKTGGVAPWEVATMQSAIRVETDFRILDSAAALHITYHLINEQGTIVLTTACTSARRYPGSYCASFSIPGGLLNSGGYFLKLLIVQNENQVLLEIPDIVGFEVIDGSVRDNAYLGREPGVVQPRLLWEVSPWPEKPIWVAAEHGLSPVQ